MVVLAPAKVVVAAVTVGVPAPATAVEEAAVTETAATRQGLGQEVEHAVAVRAVLGETQSGKWWPQLGGRSSWTQGWRERLFPRRHVKLLQFIQGFEHPPAQGQGGGWKKVSNSFSGGYCFLHRAPEHIDRDG